MRIRTYSDLSPLIGVVGYHVPSLGLIYLVAEELRMPSVEVLNWLPYLASSEATREAMLNHRSTLALDMVVPTPTPPTDPYDRLFDEPTPSPSEPTDRTPQNETIRLRAWPVRSSNDTGSQSESEDSAEAPAWPCAFLGVLVLEEELITWNQMEDIEKGTSLAISRVHSFLDGRIESPAWLLRGRAARAPPRRPGLAKLQHPRFRQGDGNA